MNFDLPILEKIFTAICNRYAEAHFRAVITASLNPTSRLNQSCSDKEARSITGLKRLEHFKGV